MENLLLIAYTIGFLLSLTILFNHKNWQNPKFWLGMLILAFSFILFDAWGSIVNLSETINIFGYTHYRILMLIPTSLWMYINGLVHHRVQFGKFEKILFAFLGLELVMLGLLFWSQGAWMSYDHFYSISRLIENLCIIISVLVFWKANQSLTTLKEKIRNNYADGSERSYDWLKEFFFLLAILLLIWFLVVNTYSFVEIDINFWYQLIWIPLCLLIFYLVIRALSTREVLHEFELESNFKHGAVKSSSTRTTKEEAAKQSCTLSPRLGKLQLEILSEINPSDKTMLLNLIRTINEKELFKVKRLNINECAQLTGISKKNISRLVNHYLQLSFSDFINLFRIEDFKEKIGNGEAAKYSLLHIALESGFSSKSTFYYTFKKLSKTSPVQILNQAKKT